MLFRHNLSGILASAVRSSNSQFDDPDLLSRLDIELLEHTQNETGWDSFCLNYRTDSPINTVITKANIKYYGQMFCLLWKLKRLELVLSSRWCSSNRLSTESSSRNASYLKVAHIICQEMTHFVYQLQYYFQFEVIECSWDAFVKELTIRPDNSYSYDFSALVDLHGAFLDSLKSKGFLSLEVPPIAAFHTPHSIGISSGN